MVSKRGTAFSFLDNGSTIKIHSDSIDFNLEFDPFMGHLNIGHSFKTSQIVIKIHRTLEKVMVFIIAVLGPSCGELINRHSMEIHWILIGGHIY